MTRQNALLLALLCSVAMNLLVAGVVIGRAGGEPPREPPPMAWAARELEPEVQQMLRSRMRKMLPSVRPLRREIRSANLEVRRAMGRDEFDREVAGAALARMRAATNRYQALLHENLIEVAAELPVEQRATLLRAALNRGGGGGKPPHLPPRPD
jgi:uncharacterized membrane protein